MVPKAIVDAVDAPAFAVDDHRRIVAWNAGAERLLGRSAAEVLGRPCYEVLRGLDTRGNAFCRADCNAVWSGRRGRPIFPFPLSVASSRGRVHAVLSVTVLSVPEGPLLVHVLGRTGKEAPPIDAKALTRRETEILRLLAGGQVVKEIAWDLHVSVATVRAHVKSCLRKLGSHSQREAIARAFADGML